MHTPDCEVGHGELCGTLEVKNETKQISSISSYAYVEILIRLHYVPNQLSFLVQTETEHASKDTFYKVHGLALVTGDPGVK